MGQIIPSGGGYTSGSSHASPTARPASTTVATVGLALTGLVTGVVAMLPTIGGSMFVWEIALGVLAGVVIGLLRQDGLAAAAVEAGFSAKPFRVGHFVLHVAAGLFAGLVVGAAHATVPDRALDFAVTLLGGSGPPGPESAFFPSLLLLLAIIILCIGGSTLIGFLCQPISLIAIGEEAATGAATKVAEAVTEREKRKPRSLMKAAGYGATTGAVAGVFLGVLEGWLAVDEMIDGASVLVLALVVAVIAGAYWVTHAKGYQWDNLLDALKTLGQLLLMLACLVGLLAWCNGSGGSGSSGIHGFRPPRR